MITWILKKIATFKTFFYGKNYDVYYTFRDESGCVKSDFFPFRVEKNVDVTEFAFIFKEIIETIFYNRYDIRIMGLIEQ